MRVLPFLLWTGVAFAIANVPGNAAERGAPSIYGRSIQIDPNYAYYRDRSAASIAAEVRAIGYAVVHYIVTADSNVEPALVDALHRERIGVWYLTFGNGTYSTKDLPPGWPAWRMITRTELAGGTLRDGYTRLCLNNLGYRAWKKARIAQTLRTVKFDGIDIAEPHWPEYPGIESPAYGCFCRCCADAFRKMFPAEDALPDILHADSPRSPAKNPQLWRRWLEFRRTTLTAFLDDLVNGPGGIRQTAPKAKVCVWTLALSETDGLRRVLEDSGEDAGEIARVVRPDLHCLQTHWPDWLRSDLPPTYVDAYRPFIEQIRKAAPKLPLMIQADTGSKPENQRSWKWIHDFETACARIGVESTTFYEYHIGRYMYTDPPRVAEVHSGTDGIVLLFTKRLDTRVAKDPARYTVSPGRVAGVDVDGSVVRLSLQGVRRGQECTITLRGVADDPTRRLEKGQPAAVLDEQTVKFRR